jgi:putative flippase GtrA
MVIVRGRWGRFLRYAATSAVASLASAATLWIAYRLLNVGPLVASVAAFGAGALVNFTGNRFWAWARRHRRGLGRDAAYYAAMAIGTAVAAAFVTRLADGYTGRLSISDNEQAVLVEAAYFGTYAAMFLVKFMVLDRVLFATRPAATPEPVENTTPG